MTAKVLTQWLRQLERDRLVMRTSTGGVPPRTGYTISKVGLSLSPAFRALAASGIDNVHLVEQSRQRYDRSGRPRPA